MNLEKQLLHARMWNYNGTHKEEEWRRLYLRHFQGKQARIVEAAIEAAMEEHKRKLAEMRYLLQ